MSRASSRWSAGSGRRRGTPRVGMDRRQALRRVVAAGGAAHAAGPFLERAIELMKTTTLVATVSYADLLFQATEVVRRRPSTSTTRVGDRGGADLLHGDQRRARGAASSDARSAEGQATR